MLALPQIHALRAIHLNRIRLPREHVPAVKVGGVGMGSAGGALGSASRVQGAPRVTLRIPSFIRKPVL